MANSYFNKLLFSFLFLALLGCTSVDTVSIGLAIELSDYGSFSGEDIRKGADLAAEQINKRGGIHGKTLELIYEDTQTSPAKAVLAMQKLTSVNQVPVVLSGWTAETNAMAPIAHETKTVLISVTGGGDGGGKNGPYVFRTWPEDSLEVERAASYMFEQGETAVIVHTQSAWEDGLRAWFRESFEGEILGEFTQTDTSDWRATIAKIKELNPVSVYAALDLPALGAFVKQAREMQLDAIIVSTSWTEDPQILAAAGSAADGVIYPRYTAPADVFSTMFEERYGEPSIIAADVAYDTIMILADVMSEYGTSAEDIRIGLQSVEYTGASGSITFNEVGDRVARDLTLKTIENSEFVVINN